MRDADAALFMIDAREGLTPLDEEIGRWLRAETTPVIVVANKAEGRAGETGIFEAFRLGLGDPIAISAEHGEGVADLFEALRPHVERDETSEAERRGPAKTRRCKLAIVGRPNAGKSTLVNRMLGEERMITGPEAGITRDSISLDWEWEGRPVRLVDTAGLQKARQGRRQARAAVRRRHQPRDRLCRSRRAAARRHPRPGSAGPQDRQPGDRGGAGADHRAQQMGRGRKCLVAVQRRQGGARRGARAIEGRAAADRLGEDRQGHRHDPQGRVRAARGVEPARSRPASSTAGSSARSRPIRRRRPRASGSSCATSPR